MITGYPSVKQQMYGNCTHNSLPPNIGFGLIANIWQPTYPSLLAVRRKPLPQRIAGNTRRHNKLAFAANESENKIAQIEKY